MYLCLHVCKHVRMYVCMYVRMYVCMYVIMYVCMYACTQISKQGTPYVYMSMSTVRIAAQRQDQYAYIYIYMRIIYRLYALTYKRFRVFEPVGFLPSRRLELWISFRTPRPHPPPTTILTVSEEPVISRSRGRPSSKPQILRFHNKFYGLRTTL